MMAVQSRPNQPEDINAFKQRDCGTCRKTKDSLAGRQRSKGKEPKEIRN
jgi:hypothetical protein